MSWVDKFAIAVLMWLAGCGAAGLYLLHVTHSVLETMMMRCA